MHQPARILKAYVEALSWFCERKIQNNSILDSTAILSKNPSREEEKKNFFRTNQSEGDKLPSTPRQSKKGGKVPQPTLTPPRLPPSPVAQYELTNPLKLPVPLPLLYSIKKIHRFHSQLLRHCVKRVPARA